MPDTTDLRRMGPLLGLIAVCLCGPVGAWALRGSTWALQASACEATNLLVLLLVSPTAEELVFRMGLHQWIARRFPTRSGLFGVANVLTALAFGLAHALVHVSAADMLIAVPALLIGWTWEISANRIAVPVVLHGWFNLCLVFFSC